MVGQHRPGCAKRQRERGADEGWSVDKIAAKIETCCRVTRLRAQRLARGWTLRQAAARFHDMCEAEGVNAPKLDEDQLGVWEKNPARLPRAKTIDLLCRLYTTDSQGLGLSGNYREARDVEVRRPMSDVSQTVASTDPTATYPATGDSLAAMAENARRSVDRTLAAASVTPGQLDLLDERFSWLSHQYVYTPPEPMLRALLGELADVHALASERQPAAIQVRLSEITALISTLVADSLMKLGRLRESHAWYATARTAADDSCNIDVRARVRAQAAMLPYYYGPLEAAVSLAREARLLSANRPTATAAFASAAEARALARQGDAVGAAQSVDRARGLFERCSQGLQEDAFAFPERRLLLYLSGAYTSLGQGRRARQVRQHALQLYPSKTGIDPALLRLEEAICLSQERSLTEACQLAQATFLGVPEGHRTHILGARAQHVIEVLPMAMRTARAVRELDEALTLSTGAR